MAFARVLESARIVPFSCGLVGDHVEGGAGVNLGDGQDTGVGRICFAADDGLQALHDGGGTDDRVDGVLRGGGVTAAAADADGESVDGCEEGTGATGDHADFQARPAVKAKDRFDFRIFEDARRHHFLGAAPPSSAG